MRISHLLSKDDLTSDLQEFGKTVAWLLDLKMVWCLARFHGKGSLKRIDDGGDEHRVLLGRFMPVRASGATDRLHTARGRFFVFGSDWDFRDGLIARCGDYPLVFSDQAKVCAPRWLLVRSSWCLKINRWFAPCSFAI